MGFQMTDFEFEKFFTKFDRRQRGTITFNEFQETVGDYIQPHEKALVYTSKPPEPPTFMQWLYKAVKTGKQSWKTDEGEVLAKLRAKSSNGNTTRPPPPPVFPTLNTVRFGPCATPS